jgi:drug/metabolite transporter (DMT)-like permease
MRINRSMLALTAAGLAWGLTVPMSKVVLAWLDPAWTTVARFAIAAPVLALIARRNVRANLSPVVAAWGAVGFGFVIVLQNIGITRTSVTHAAVILGAVPVLVALTAAAAGRGNAGPQAWAGFAVGLAGMAMVAGGGGDASVGGDLLMLASAALSALTIEAQSRLLPGRDAVAVTAVQMGAAALVVLPLALTAGELPSALPTATQAVNAAGLVLVGSLLPFALYAYGQKHVPAEVAGAFVNLEPLVGAGLGALVFHDPFGGLSAIGGVVVVIGIALSTGSGPGSRRLRLTARGTGRSSAVNGACAPSSPSSPP